MIHVIASIKVKSGKRDILIEHLKPLQGPSDKGNLISTPQGAQ